MCVVHLNTDCMKAVLIDKSYDLFCPVVRHQEIGIGLAQNLKQASVVDCEVRIEAGTSLFPTLSSIRRIYKNRRFLSPAA